MQDKLKKYFLEFRARHHRLVVAFAVLFLVFVIAVVVQAIWFEKETTVDKTDNEDVAQTVADIDGPVLSESVPTTIHIPKLNLNAEFEEPLGVDQNLEIEVPEAFDTVGYYKYGPTPGELGPAVVLGHVDSVDGPAVFYSLGELEPGDEIDISREDGSVATFEVTKLERPLQSEFPTEQVYGNIDYAGLRLVTCSGYYDKGIKRYTHNLIVYAKLKEI